MSHNPALGLPVACWAPQFEASLFGSQRRSRELSGVDCTSRIEHSPIAAAAAQRRGDARDRVPAAASLTHGCVPGAASLTASPRFMGAAATGFTTRVAALTCAAGVCAANAVLLCKTFCDLSRMSALGSQLFAVACGLGIALLAWVSFVPLRETSEPDVASGARRLGLRIS